VLIDIVPLVVPPELLLELPPLLLLLLEDAPPLLLLLLLVWPPLLLLLLVTPPLLLLLLVTPPLLLLLLLLVWPPLLLLLLVTPPELLLELLLVEPPLLLLLLLEMPPLLLLPTEFGALVETVPEPVHADNAPSTAQQTPRARICFRFTAGICMTSCSLIVPPSHSYSRSPCRQSVPKTRRSAAFSARFRARCECVARHKSRTNDAIPSGRPAQADARARGDIELVSEV
jgi:hypothetical protein